MSYGHSRDPEEGFEFYGPGSRVRTDPDEEYDRWRDRHIEPDVDLTDNRTTAEIEEENAPPTES